MTNKTIFEIDGIHLDQDNKEFNYALQYALESNRNIYLTGKAGSGKTTFLKYLRKVSSKKMVVLAPTGVAAVNAGGQTIHSFFKIAPSIYVPGDKRLRTYAPEGDPDRSTIYQHFRYRDDHRQIINSLELMVIDEVSMVRADLLDVVDTLLRVYRKNSQPFGGVQVILIGDTFQLPPVVKGEDKNLLYQFYDSEFFFSARVIKKDMPFYIELKKIYRQNEQDFIDLLNRVRVNRLIPNDYRLLNSRLDPSFNPDEKDGFIILATTNEVVNNVNEQKLADLKARLQVYTAEIKGDFPIGIRPTETELRIKDGAQVMFLRNDASKGIYNGKIGTVVSAEEDKIFVEFEGEHGQKNRVCVEQDVWRNVSYRWNEESKCVEEEIIGEFKQYPLRLAWAITVHKSQGLTFEKVIADVGYSFASGQVYVALSRCTSLNGLVLTSPITPRSIKTDRRVIQFAENETPETLLSEQLIECKADYYYQASRKSFNARDVDGAVNNFLTAIKYRNDINTDLFRRYISVWMRKLFLCVDSEKMLARTVLNMEEQLERATIKISTLNGTINDNDETISILSSQIDGFEYTIASLRNKEAQLETSLKSAERGINERSGRISDLEKNLEETSNSNAEMKKRIQQLEATIEEKNIEIVRLSNIKWYQKLLGKK